MIPNIEKGWIRRTMRRDLKFSANDQFKEAVFPIGLGKRLQAMIFEIGSIFNANGDYFQCACRTKTQASMGNALTEGTIRHKYKNAVISSSGGFVTDDSVEINLYGLETTEPNTYAHAHNYMGGALSSSVLLVYDEKK